jgi:microcystin-dependent protein
MDEYLGTIKLTAAGFVSKEYLECNGQLLSVSQNQALYALLGNKFGGNLNDNNFALPTLTPPSVDLKYIICVDGVFPQMP